jgi:cation transport ATPase
MAKKKKKSDKKARKEAQRRAEEEAKRLAEEAKVRRRRLLIAVVVLTIGAALGCWFGLENERLTGIAILVGGLLFLLVALGALGAGIRPRDRDRAGAIDFGAGKDR